MRCPFPAVALLLAIPGLVFSAVPAAAQESTTFETLDVALTPTNFTITLKRTIVKGDDATDARWVMDNEYGNKNDVAEPAEVKAYAAAWRDDLNRQLTQFESSIFKPWGQIQVDGRPAQKVRATAVTIAGAEGVTSKTDAYAVDFHAYMAFAPSTKQRVEVRLGQEFMLPFLFYNTANLTAGTPWRIDPDDDRKEYWTGNGYYFPFDDVEKFSSASNPHFFNLTTEPEETGGKKKKDSPGPSLPVAVALIALTASLMRRKKM